MQPDHGQVFSPEPGLRGILAANPGPMTGRGTITWIVGEGEVAVIDPGPRLGSHRAALAAALAGERVAAVLVTHAHLDHSGMARDFARGAGAPLVAFGDAAAGRSPRMQGLARAGLLAAGEGVDRGFRPDRALADGATLSGPGWRLTALHTPGHFGNHLCLAWGDRIFSGDLVMGWSSSVVAPPDGDMGDYLASLDRIGRLAARRLYPTHGAPVEEPGRRIAELVAHRRLREAQIREALAAGPATAAELAGRIYAGLSGKLLAAASMNVLAHLIDLADRNLAEPLGPLAPATRFRRPD